MHSSGRIHNKGTRCKSLAAFLPVSVCIVCYRDNNVQCSLVFPRKHYFTFVSSSSTHRDSHSAGVCRRLSTVQTNLRTVTHRAQHTANFFILTYICRVRSVCVYCVGFFGVASRHHSATFTFGSAGAAISVSSTCTCREQQQQKKNRKEIINIAQTAYMKRHLLKTAAVDCFYYTCLFYISVLAVFYSSSTLLLLTTHCVIVCDV